MRADGRCNLDLKVTLTCDAYVTQKAWRNASLTGCPLHPQGGCGFARHGCYQRVSPPGTRIARWYCPTGHCTFSLLPDCLSARLSGTLAEVEDVVTTVEQAPSLEAACDELRMDIELPGALRWVRRRVQTVHSILHTLKGLMPDAFEGCEITLLAFAMRLGVDVCLPLLREIAAVYLPHLPTPLGLIALLPPGGEQKIRSQHKMGPDPPPVLV